MKNILVTIDFDNKEHILVNKASEFAKAFQAKLWIVHVAAPDPDFVGYEVGPKYIRDSRAEELREEHRILQKFAEEQESKGIACEGLLIQGATIQMIIEESIKLNVDLIVAGHHEHGFLYKAFAGSTSSDIIKKSKIPVLLVPLN